MKQIIISTLLCLSCAVYGQTPITKSLNQKDNVVTVTGGDNTILQTESTPKYDTIPKWITCFDTAGYWHYFIRFIPNANKNDSLMSKNFVEDSVWTYGGARVVMAIKGYEVRTKEIIYDPRGANIPEGGLLRGDGNGIVPSKHVTYLDENKKQLKLLVHD